MNSVKIISFLINLYFTNLFYNKSMAKKAGQTRHKCHICVQRIQNVHTIVVNLKNYLAISGHRMAEAETFTNWVTMDITKICFSVKPFKEKAECLNASNPIMFERRKWLSERQKYLCFRQRCCMHFWVVLLLETKWDWHSSIWAILQ